MAEGYSRASGRLGVAFGIGGPGITNMVTAVAAARADRSAVLAISGEVATGTEGRGTFQDASGVALDDVSVLRPVTAESLSVNSPGNLQPYLRVAALTALRERAPVGLTPVQRAVVHAVDHVADDAEIPDDVQSVLVEAAGEAGVVEVVAICGLYALMGYMCTAFGITTEPGLPTPPWSRDRPGGG